MANRQWSIGQLIEYSKRIFFLKNHAENKARRIVPGLYLLFIKTLYDVKTTGL